MKNSFDGLTSDEIDEKVKYIEHLTKKEAYEKLPKKYQQLIDATKKSSIGIDAKISEKELPLTVSKFGGLPFVSENSDFPLDCKGYPYQLLAQINFADVYEQLKVFKEPAMSGLLSELPTSGLLQIFVPVYSNGYAYGSDDGSHVVRYLTEDDLALPVDNHMIEKLRSWYQEFLEFKRDDEIISSNHLTYKTNEDYYEAKKNVPFRKKHGESYLILYTEFELTFNYDEVSASRYSREGRQKMQELNIDEEDFNHYYEATEDCFAYTGSSEIAMLYDKMVLHTSNHSMSGDIYEYIDFFQGTSETITDARILLTIGSQYEDKPIFGWGNWQSSIMVSDVKSAFFTMTEEEAKNKDFSNVKFWISP